MPVLKDFRQTKTISLSRYEGSEIQIYNSVLAKDGDILVELQENPTKISKLLEVLPKFIKSWNFEDEKNQALPISSQSLELLDMNDLNEIVDAIKEYSDSLKKN